LRFHRIPIRIDGLDGAVTSITFAQSMVIDGVPVAVPGTQETVQADTVIRAIGQSKLVALFAAFDVRHEHGIPVVDETLRTSNARVFAAGDCIFRSGMTDAMVVVAAQQGKIVAANVNRTLTGAPA
jgi:glutamate synthase (NADPH/NADH) small chain